MTTPAPATSARGTCPLGGAPASRSTRSGATSVASKASSAGGQRRGAAAAHGGGVGGQLGQRLLAPRQRGQRIGLADRARDQDPQRVAARGVVRLVLDDRGQRVRGEPLQRPAGDVHARAQQARAERQRARSGHDRDGPAGDQAVLEHRHPREHAAMRRDPAPDAAQRAGERQHVEGREREQQHAARVELTARHALDGRHQHVAVEADGVEHEQQREQERGGAERGDRELGAPQVTHRRACGACRGAPRRARSTWRAKCASARSPKSSTSARTSASARACR